MGQLMWPGNGVGDMVWEWGSWCGLGMGWVTWPGNGVGEVVWEWGS